MSRVLQTEAIESESVKLERASGSGTQYRNERQVHIRSALIAHLIILQAFVLFVYAVGAIGGNFPVAVPIVVCP